jgi:putative SOS response-associated peptidase YedK
VSRFSLIFDAHVHGLVADSLAAVPIAMRHSRYNIGRDQDIIVLCPDADGTATDDAGASAEQSSLLAARTMRWGFTPHWIHGPNPALQPLTVPAGKISQPYFRDAFRQRRCLIPATGFYAWQGWENGPAAPYHVRMRNQQVFFMAAIWDHCENVDRVAMLTTEANSLIRPIHDRMPAIIPREAVGAWLHGDRPQQLLAPYAPGTMEIYQVSRKIFSPGSDSPELIEPVAAAPAMRARA